MLQVHTLILLMGESKSLFCILRWKYILHFKMEYILHFTNAIVLLPPIINIKSCENPEIMECMVIFDEGICVKKNKATKK